MKKRRKVNPNAIGDFLKASENAGSTTGLTTENFESKLAFSLNYYQRNFDLKDSREFLAKARPEIDKQINSLSDKEFNEFKTVGFVFHFLKENKLKEDFHEPTRIWIEEKITELLSIKKEKKELTSQIETKPKHDIQKAIRVQAYQFLPEIEDYVDAFAFDNNKTDFDLIDFLKKNSLSSIHTRKLQNFFIKHLEEYKDIPNDEQLKEAYRYLTEGRRQKIIAFYEELNNNFDLYCKNLSPKKTRAHKKIAPEKLVAKVQYMKNDLTLGISSCDPVKIIGAKALVLYSTRYKKLSILRGKSLSMKGTTITGFEPILSSTKILRKPETFLSMFSKLPNLEEVMKELDKLSTKPSEATGRINNDTLIVWISR